MLDTQNILFRLPKLEDGMPVFNLIANTPPLDTNSAYCNLLQCSHFANTSVVAEQNSQLMGFISGYILPDRPETLFVWQVAISEKARGKGVASGMLQHLIERTACERVQYIETSITDDNQASWGLFRSFAKKHCAALHTSKWMDKTLHFSGEHDTEMLVRIGPFKSHS